MKKRGFCGVGLHMPKNCYNIGSVLRACQCYNVNFLVSSGRRYQKASTDTTKAYRHIPFFEGREDIFDSIPRDCVPVAVDLLPEARNIVDYVHPERAYYIFGPEDGTLGSKVTSRCRDVIYVPTEFCMNLAATVNVVLYDRMAKNKIKEKRI